MQDNSLEINDQVTGEFSEAEAFYHLYPGAAVDLQGKKILLDDICIKFQTNAEVFLKDTCYYPEFGKVIANKCLVVKLLNNQYSIKFICHKVGN